jgi:hypothetical protein
MSRQPAPVTLSFGDQVSLGFHREEPGEITPELYAWVSKKFGKGRAVSLTTFEASKAQGRIEIHKPKGRMGVKTITVTRRGRHLIVRDDQGGGMAKPTTQFFELRESLA